MKIFTIGHSTKTFDEFLELLDRFKIKKVIDVRRFPSSKKFPWFTKEFLEEQLPIHKISYVWLEELGGYRKGGYLEYTKTKEFKKAIEKLLEICKEGNSVIMCSEFKWWKCHRRYIANYLVKKGHQVIHILTKNRIQNHNLKDKYIQQRLKAKIKCDKK